MFPTPRQAPFNPAKQAKSVLDPVDVAMRYGRYFPISRDLLSVIDPLLIRTQLFE